MEDNLLGCAIKYADEIKRLKAVNAELVEALEHITDVAIACGKETYPGEVHDPECAMCKAIVSAKQALNRAKEVK